MRRSRPQSGPRRQNLRGKQKPNVPSANLIETVYMPKWDSTLQDVIENTQHDAFYPQLKLSWFPVKPDNPCSKPLHLCGKASDWEKTHKNPRMTTGSRHQSGSHKRKLNFCRSRPLDRTNICLQAGDGVNTKQSSKRVRCSL